MVFWHYSCGLLPDAEKTGAVSMVAVKLIKIRNRVSAHKLWHAAIWQLERAWLIQYSARGWCLAGVTG